MSICKKVLIFIWTSASFHLALAECDIRSASQLNHEREVGPVTDLEKTKSTGKCVVRYRLMVDGVWNLVQAEEAGLEQEESLCYYAIEKARRELLVGLGGTFQTEAITVCKDGRSASSKLTIGDTILENEVAWTKKGKYFNYRNSKCRLFIDRRELNRQLNVTYGVICQIDSNGENWIVVDKW